MIKIKEHNNTEEKEKIKKLILKIIENFEENNISVRSIIAKVTANWEVEKIKRVLKCKLALKKLYQINARWCKFMGGRRFWY